MDTQETTVKSVEAAHPESEKPAPRVDKIIVAVHGIGDQFQFATIQSVANRFCIAHKNPQGLPLGKFYDMSIGTLPETYLLQVAIDQNSKENTGFAEIYWADIPRIPETAGYTLEESKKWAQTVIDRLRPHCGDESTQLRPPDVEMAKALLEEMIETITVLERLVSLAGKAGLFHFNLKAILIDYLGDVQLVTDFKKYRDKILHRFFGVMNHIATFNGKAEIYIVAHSQGTVVTFLSLLEAIRGNVPVDDEPGPNLNCDWVKQVRGLMTIGSPIDKHLILWPDLWTKLGGPDRRNSPDYKILWRNYYDYGDPIGFELDTTRAWLCEHHLEDIFEFPKSNDHGFGRYPFPGKAHNDYWNDTEVFDHFIRKVVRAAPIRKDSPTSMCPAEDPNKPRPAAPEADAPSNKNLIRFLSNVLPYVLAFGLIFLGVYFLYKAVNEYQELGDRTSEILRNVLGITFLLAGLTVAAQIPRLTRSWKWRFSAFAIFTLFAAAYGYTTTCEVRSRLGCFIASLFVGNPTVKDATTAIIALASVIAIAVYIVGRKKSRYGLRALLGLSTVALVLSVGVSVFWEDVPRCNCPADNTSATNVVAPPGSAVGRTVQGESGDSNKRPIWPLFIATAAFLYLWWLAALIFDLVVVWHYYIRRSVAMDRLHAVYRRRLPDTGESGPTSIAAV